MVTAIRKIRDYCLRERRKSAIDSAWAQRHEKVYGINPAYGKACPRETERAHIELWKPIRRRIRLDTLRICANISGNVDIRIVPEEVFACEIEHCIGPNSWARTIGHKSLYDRLFPAGILPTSFLHRLDGGDYD